MGSRSGWRPTRRSLTGWRVKSKPTAAPKFLQVENPGQAATKPPEAAPKPPVAADGPAAKPAETPSAATLMGVPGVPTAEPNAAADPLVDAPVVDLNTPAVRRARALIETRKAELAQRRPASPSPKNARG